MADDAKRFWSNGGLTSWLVQRGIYVIILAGVFWLQLHFTTKDDFDKKKEEDLRAQLELNKILNEVNLRLKEVDDNHKHDEQIDKDHEARLRALEGKR